MEDAADDCCLQSGERYDRIRTDKTGAAHYIENVDFVLGEGTKISLTCADSGRVSKDGFVIHTRYHNDHTMYHYNIQLHFS